MHHTSWYARVVSLTRSNTRTGCHWEKSCTAKENEPGTQSFLVSQRFSPMYHQYHVISAGLHGVRRGRTSGGIRRRRAVVGTDTTCSSYLSVETWYTWYKGYTNLS